MRRLPTNEQIKKIEKTDIIVEQVPNNKYKLQKIGAISAGNDNKISISAPSEFQVTGGVINIRSAQTVMTLNESGVEILKADGPGTFIYMTDNVYLPNLPTSDPHVANALWNDNGVLKISAGE